MACWHEAVVGGVGRFGEMTRRSLESPLLRGGCLTAPVPDLVHLVSLCARSLFHPLLVNARCLRPSFQGHDIANKVRNAPVHSKQRGGGGCLGTVHDRPCIPSKAANPVEHGDSVFGTGCPTQLCDAGPSGRGVNVGTDMQTRYAAVIDGCQQHGHEERSCLGSSW